MAKKKVQSAFFCQSCGTQSPKWLGKCPQCNEWNTFVEEVISKEEKTKSIKSDSSLVFLFQLMIFLSQRREE